MKPRKVGACRVGDELGKGGMAVVYRGLHEPLQREVAIKELPADWSKAPEALSRFKREAMALAAFRHQNIVTLYDFIEKNDAFYMVMELVDGPTLSELLKDGPMPAEVAAVVGSQLASALEHAHFARIVHRDLKPGNVMVAKSGEVKLMDFGIAKDEDLGKLTKTGLAVGTPAYMSPEQVSGGEIDPRSDIYSLGVLLYECVSGLKPFTGSSAGEVFARIHDGKYPPLKKVAPGLPVELRKIIQRAMKKKPDHRYFDVAEMHRALQGFLSTRLRTSQSALLLSYLHQRKRITETEALARLTQAEIIYSEQLEEQQAAPKSGWRWLTLLTVLAIGGGLAFTRTSWWPLVEATMRPWLGHF